MFVLKLIIGLLQAPVRRIAELLGLGVGGAPQPSAPTPERRDREAQPPPPSGRPDAGPPPTPPSSRPEAGPPPRRAPVPPPPPSRVKEVDEEPVLAAEFADQGAEDGAGAEVRVDEPWEGYSRMRVPQVTDRLSGATTAELGAVRLYEAAHRKRVSVLRAVDARMRAQPL